MSRSPGNSAFRSHCNHLVVRSRRMRRPKFSNSHSRDRSNFMFRNPDTVQLLRDFERLRKRHIREKEACSIAIAISNLASRANENILQTGTYLCSKQEGNLLQLALQHPNSGLLKIRTSDSCISLIQRLHFSHS